MKKLLSSFGSVSLFLLSAISAQAQTIDIQRPKNIPSFQIGQVVSAVVGILLLIAAVLAFLYLILGGIQWITSGGDKSGMETARNRITAAVVGLIIVAASWAVMLLIGQFIGFDILKGNVPIPTIPNPN